MVGAILIILIVVVVIPVGLLMMSAAAIAIIGGRLKGNAEETHPGSELIDLNE